MKIVKGYVEETINIEAECPYCQNNQVDINISSKQAFKGNILEHICEVCGMEFKIEVE